MIKPISIEDGQVLLCHDREETGGAPVGGHEGRTSASDLRYARDASSNDRPDHLELPCPEAGCSWMSTQPINGGNLSDKHAQVLQQVFLEKLVLEGWHPDEALAQVSDLITAQDGERSRNLLLNATATPIEPGESSMPEETEAVAEATVADDNAYDLGAAIVAEIDRTLAISVPSGLSPLTAELVNHVIATREVIRLQADALKRIKAVLVTARGMSDNGVTSE